MANLPPKILPRLGQLIRMLGSDQDGEALNAARAIARTLESEGKTFHELAVLVESGSNLDFAPPPRTEGRHGARTPTPPPPPYYRSRPNWEDLREFQKRDWLTVFLTKLRLSPEQAALMTDYRVKANAEDLMHWFPSEKQLRVAKQLLKLAWKTGARP